MTQVAQTIPMSTQITRVATTSLTPYARNARTHSRRQIDQIAASIERFGFTNPILTGEEGQVIAGHGRPAAAKKLGLGEVPVIRLAHLSAAERRAYVLADNRLAEKAGWDQELLAIELQGLIDLDFDMDLTGFEIAEIDLILDDAQARDPAGGAAEVADLQPPAREGAPVTQRGDLWHLGRHRLLCGDARDSADLDRLCDGTKIDLIFTDPPYNVRINGHVSGSGKHAEFAFASGEMDAQGFTQFLTETLGMAAAQCRDGAIAFVCMDWRHMREMLAAGDAVFGALKNLCVWNKTNGGMGSFYRSKHELVFVWKVGTGPHVNAFGLGETGRYRTNVWDYAGVNSFGAERAAELAMHPTVKPVGMIADAIRDCTRRGETVLDPFAGSGSTLIAALECGRVAYALDYEPGYCDTIIARWQALTGRQARLGAEGPCFEETAEARS